MTEAQQNMNKSDMWLIRDARGLGTYEKVFLYTVASRGMVKTSRIRLMGDTAMSTGMITKVVRSLQDKGLINVYPSTYSPVTGKRGQTFYSMNSAALSEWVEVGSLSESECSLSELGSSLSESECSLSGVKEDIEGNSEVDTKGNSRSTVLADAPTVDSDMSQRGGEELETSATLFASIEPPALLPQDKTPVLAKATEGAPVHSVNQVPQRMTLRDIAHSRSSKMPVREADEW